MLSSVNPPTLSGHPEDGCAIGRKWRMRRRSVDRVVRRKTQAQTLRRDQLLLEEAAAAAVSSPEFPADLMDDDSDSFGDASPVGMSSSAPSHGSSPHSPLETELLHGTPSADPAASSATPENRAWRRMKFGATPKPKFQREALRQELRQQGKDAYLALLSALGDRVNGGLAQWNPDLYRWMCNHMTSRGKTLLLISLILLTASDFLLHDNAHPAWARGINMWSIEFATHLVSLVLSLLLSLGLDGLDAIPLVFNWHPLWRFVGASICFTAAGWLVQQAYKMGLGHAHIELIGYLYMPIAAYLSQVIFKRKYGILEWLSLGMMTLAACTFMLLRERYVAGGTDDAVEWIRKHFVPSGVALVMGGIVVSVLGSIYTETIYKEKIPGLRSQWTLGNNRFYIMKVHLEFAALILTLLCWTMPVSWTQVLKVNSYDVWFGPWTKLEVISVGVLAAQSWVAGLVTQQMNTVAKAITQTLGIILTVMIADPVLHDRYHFELRAVPELFLAVIAAMCAIIFQTGRIIIHRLRKKMDLEPDRPHEPTVFEEEDDERNGPNGLYSGVPEESESDAPSPVQPSRYDLKSPRRYCRTYASIILYIAVDVGRTLINSYALSSSAVNPTTMSIMGFVGGFAVASGLTLSLDKFPGFRSAWNFRKVMQCFPGSILFAMGQCLTSFAYALGISPALANVLGKIYTPIIAFGGRCMLDRYYSWLEYFAIIILTLASLAFGYLQEYSIVTGFQMASSTAMAFALGSAIFAAFGTLYMEKILQVRRDGNDEPFRIQKIRLDFGSILASVALLPLISTISSRPKDNIWVNRPTGQNCSACMPVLEPSPPHWPWSPVTDTCGGPACTGDCACQLSVIAGWDRPLLFIALGVNVCHGWLIGLIIKEFSSIHRAFADAFSTLLLYWVGGPLVELWANGRPFSKGVQDLCLDMVSFIVPLSTMTFMVATSQLREVMEAVNEDDKCLMQNSSLSEASSTTDVSRTNEDSEDCESTLSNDAC